MGIKLDMRNLRYVIDILYHKNLFNFIYFISAQNYYPILTTHKIYVKL